MKGVVKMIVAGVVILIIGGILLLVYLGLNGWSFKLDYEMKTYDNQSPIHTLNTKMEVGELKTEFYDGEFVIVDYPESEKLDVRCTEENGKLTVTSKMKHWYNFIGCFADFPTITVRIPKSLELNLDLTVNAGTLNLADGEYGDISVHLNAGTVKLNDITCNELKCEVNAGTLNSEKVLCLESVKTTVNAGTINLKNVNSDDIAVDVSAGSCNILVEGKKSDYRIESKVSAGSCNVENQSGNDLGKVTVKVSAGSANIKFTED
ncbi:MAG: DUF4097 domain-containing protein [Clostridia bacterium]|nr:DUF4097 domain-containing protein [Clostridia bacterium]